MKKILLFLALIVVLTIMALFNWAQITIPVNLVYLEELARRGMLSDADLYAYSGWLYVNGLSPEKVNFEHPPLGKYLIGTSIILFKNQNLLGLIFAFLILTVILAISKRILTCSFIILFPLVITGFDKIFIKFASNSALDIYLMFFTSLSALSFLKYMEKPKLLFVPLILLGLGFSCKWSAFPSLLAYIGYLLLLRKWRALKALAAYTPLTLASYMLSYSAYFLNGHNLSDFLNLQLEMYRFQVFMRYGRGQPPPLWIVMNLLTGVEGPTLIKTVILDTAMRSITPTGDVAQGLSLIQFYNPLTWPLTFSATLVSLYYFLKVKELTRLFPPVYFLSYILSTSYGQVFIWYLLPAMPFGFLSIASILEKAYTYSSKSSAMKTGLEIYLFASAFWSLFINLPPYVKIS